MRTFLVTLVDNVVHVNLALLPSFFREVYMSFIWERLITLDGSILLIEGGTTLTSSV